jgi:hypothetical protein
LEVETLEKQKKPPAAAASSPFHSWYPVLPDQSVAAKHWAKAEPLVFSECLPTNGRCFSPF